MKKLINEFTTNELISELEKRGLRLFFCDEINILQKSGYFEMFYKFTQTAKNYKEAYELTEQKLVQDFEISRYTSYESFRTAIWNYRKKNKKQV